MLPVAVMLPLTLKLPSVPTVVKLLIVTLLDKVLPVSKLASRLETVIPDS